MSKQNDAQLVTDIIEAAGKIEAYTKQMSFEQFCNDSKTLDAVIRNFEIIGEAANQLTDAFKEKNEEVEWHNIRGFRNRIVHDYINIKVCHSAIALNNSHHKSFSRGLCAESAFHRVSLWLCCKPCHTILISSACNHQIPHKAACQFD